MSNALLLTGCLLLTPHLLSTAPLPVECAKYHYLVAQTRCHPSSFLPNTKPPSLIQALVAGTCPPDTGTLPPLRTNAVQGFTFPAPDLQRMKPHSGPCCLHCNPLCPHRNDSYDAWTGTGSF